MPKPLLPPRGLFVTTGLAFDRTLPEKVKMTWIQLRMLGWGSDETPPISMDQISELTGKKQSTIYEHMAVLRDRGALRWRPAQKGTLILSFDDEAFSRNLEKPSSSSSFLSTEESTTTSVNSLRRETFQKSGNSENLENAFQKSGKEGPQTTLSDDVIEALRSIRVSEALYQEIEGSGWTDEEIIQAVKECKDEGDKPGGLFVYRIRNGQVPDMEAENYYSGIYAEFVEH
jgi:hypothetical protein